MPLPVCSDVDFVKALLTYNPKADIEADLILKEHLGHTDINGYINADRLSVKLNGKKLPDSYFHLKSDGHNSVVESDIYVGSGRKSGNKRSVFTCSQYKD